MPCPPHQSVSPLPWNTHWVFAFTSGGPTRNQSHSWFLSTLLTPNQSSGPHICLLLKSWICSLHSYSNHLSFNHHCSPASFIKPTTLYGFPDSSVGEESACNAGDLSLIPGSGRSPGERKGYPLQYSGLENSMDYMGLQRVGHSWTTFTFTTIYLVSTLPLV